MLTSSIRKMLIAVAATAALAGATAAPAMASFPVATTEAATDVAATTATVHATIAFQGSKTRAAFSYRVKGGEGEKSTAIQFLSGASPKAISATLTGLAPETTYEFEAKALDLEGGGGSIGETMTFTTTGLYPARFDAEAYPASIAGTQNVDADFVFEGLEIDCSKAELLGSAAAATEHLALYAQYGGCEVPGLPGISPSVYMNSCSYVLGPNAAGANTASYAIECAEEGDSIVVVLSYSKTPICTLSIAAQGTTGTIGTTTEGQGSARVVRAQGSTSPAYTGVGPSCGAMSISGGEAQLDVDTTLSAKAGGKGVGLYATGGPSPEGVFVEGKALAAEAYPASIAGAQSVSDDFTLGELAVDCSKADLSGPLSKASQSVSLAAAYGGCTVPGFPALSAQVNANSCDYVVGANQAGDYTASYEIACEEEADAIEVVIVGFCTISIPAQESSAVVDVSTEGVGSMRRLRAKGWATPTYSYAGPYCASIGGPEGELALHVDASLGATYLG